MDRVLAVEGGAQEFRALEPKVKQSGHSGRGCLPVMTLPALLRPRASNLNRLVEYVNSGLSSTLHKPIVWSDTERYSCLHTCEYAHMCAHATHKYLCLSSVVTYMYSIVWCSDHLACTAMAYSSAFLVCPPDWCFLITPKLTDSKRQEESLRHYSAHASVLLKKNLSRETKTPKCSRYLMPVLSLYCCRSNLVIKDISAFSINLYFQRFITS